MSIKVYELILIFFIKVLLMDNLSILFKYNFFINWN